jgi:hypothetical protein
VDIVVIAESDNLLSCELCAVVGDDRIWDPEAINDVSEERHCLLGAVFHYGSGFGPFGKFVDDHDQVCEAPRALVREVPPCPRSAS